MQPSPTGTFFKFVFGFLLFIGLSFGITIAASSQISGRTPDQQAAAAKALMLQQHK